MGDEEWMDGQADGRTDRQTDRQTDDTDRRSDGQPDERLDRPGRCTDGQTDGQTDGWTNSIGCCNDDSGQLNNRPVGLVGRTVGRRNLLISFLSSCSIIFSLIEPKKKNKKSLTKLDSLSMP